MLSKKIPDAADMPRRLRTVMKDLNLHTVDDLAQVCGVNRSAVSNWLNGYHVPPIPPMMLLAERAHLTLDWLYSGDDLTVHKSFLDKIAARLQAVRQELELPTLDDLAHLCGATPIQINYWISGRHLPLVVNMMQLCEATNLMLDWIYAGDGRGLSYAAMIRLTAILEGMQPKDPPLEPS